MTPEDGMQQVFDIGAQMSKEDESMFFRMIVVVGFAFIRGYYGNEGLEEFICDALNDNMPIRFEDI